MVSYASLDPTKQIEWMKSLLMLKFSRQSNEEHLHPNPQTSFYPENQITFIYHINPQKSNQPQPPIIKPIWIFLYLHHNINLNAGNQLGWALQNT